MLCEMLLHTNVSRSDLVKNLSDKAKPMIRVTNKNLGHFSMPIRWVVPSFRVSRATKYSLDSLESTL